MPSDLRIAADSINHRRFLSAWNPSRALAYRHCRPWPDLRRNQPYRLAANKSHRPGRPFGACEPRSANFKPAPATRSVTTLETKTSPGAQCAMTRAAACTAMPPTSRPLSSISPACRPARHGRPICFALVWNASAHRTPRPGPPNVARTPSAVALMRGDPGRQDDVDRSIAHHLKGDVDVAAQRVTRVGEFKIAHGSARLRNCSELRSGSEVECARNTGLCRS